MKRSAATVALSAEDVLEEGRSKEGDLLASEWDWRDPVVLVTVVAN